MEMENIEIKIPQYHTKIETERAVLITTVEKKIKGRRWAIMFQDGILGNVIQLKLSGEDFRVLFCLLRYMDFENWVQITQKSIAEETGIHQPNVAKSLKRLHEVGIIDIAKRGNCNLYRINYDFVWKGQYKNLLKQKKVIPFPKSV
jgi:predicted transcriptional regulator